MFIVAYYTEGTPYEVEAMALQKSMEFVRSNAKNKARRQFSWSVQSLPHPGNWKHATQLKPAFILDQLLNANLGLFDCLLYLDADARMVADPSLHLDGALEDFDVAVHYFKDRELISATIAVKKTANAVMMLSRWASQCEQHPETWSDQPLLQRVIEDMPELKVKRLGPEFNWIDAQDPARPVDLSERHYGPRDNIYIRQTQGSRRHKQAVNARGGA